MKEVTLTVSLEEYNLIQSVLQKFLTFEKAHSIVFKLGSQFEEQNSNVIQFPKKEEDANIQSN